MEPTPEPRDGWRPGDIALGVLFVTAGALVTTYTYLAMRNDAPASLWALGWIIGPLLLLLGGNAIVRSLRAR